MTGMTQEERKRIDEIADALEADETCPCEPDDVLFMLNIIDRLTAAPQPPSPRSQHEQHRVSG